MKGKGKAGKYFAAKGSKMPTSGKKGHKLSAAVELGKLGGKKGGPARARKLSANKRTEIAKQGGKARVEYD